MVEVMCWVGKMLDRQKSRATHETQSFVKHQMLQAGGMVICIHVRFYGGNSVLQPIQFHLQQIMSIPGVLCQAATM